MELAVAIPFYLVTVGIVVTLTVVDRLRVVRRILAGSILVLLGVVLGCSQVSFDPLRLAFGAVLLLAWAGTGIGAGAGHEWGRRLGLVLAAAGCLVAAWGSTQAGPGGDLLLVHLFFTVRSPDFAWINVAIGLVAFAQASAIAGTLLIRPNKAGPTRAS